MSGFRINAKCNILHKGLLVNELTYETMNKQKIEQQLSNSNLSRSSSKLTNDRLTTERKALDKAIKYFGNQTKLAIALEVPQSQISIWINREHRIGASDRILKLEKITNGLVTRYELRPDLYGEPPTVKSTANQLLLLLKKIFYLKPKQKMSFFLFASGANISMTKNLIKKVFSSPLIISLSFLLVLLTGILIGTANNSSTHTNQVTKYLYANDSKESNDKSHSNKQPKADYLNPDHCIGSQCK